MTTLVLAVPLTSRDRGWPNHVLIDAPSLGQPSFAMTEQVRVVSRGRLVSLVDTVSAATLRAVREWIREYLYERDDIRVRTSRHTALQATDPTQATTLIAHTIVDGDSVEERGLAAAIRIDSGRYALRRRRAE